MMDRAEFFKLIAGGLAALGIGAKEAEAYQTEEARAELLPKVLEAGRLAKETPYLESGDRAEVGLADVQWGAWRFVAYNLEVDMLSDAIDVTTWEDGGMRSMVPVYHSTVLGMYIEPSVAADLKPLKGKIKEARVHLLGRPEGEAWVVPNCFIVAVEANDLGTPWRVTFEGGPMVRVSE